MSKSGFFWNDKKIRFSLIVEQRFRNTSSRPIMIEEVSQSWMKLSSLNEVKLIVLIKETNNFDEINNFSMNNYWNKIKNFVKRKGLHSIHSRRKFVEDRDTIFELTAKIQELQNEINCMNDSRDFQDAESVRSEHFPRYQSTCVFPTCKIHKSCCMSRIHSRPKSFARIYLPTWTSWA